MPHPANMRQKAPQSRKRPCRAFVKYAAVHRGGTCIKGRARFPLQARHSTRPGSMAAAGPAIGISGLCTRKHGQSRSALPGGRLILCGGKIFRGPLCGGRRKSRRGCARKSAFQERMFSSKVKICFHTEQTLCSSSLLSTCAMMSVPRRMASSDGVEKFSRTPWHGASPST